jgi:hypothetical protein
VAASNAHAAAVRKVEWKEFIAQLLLQSHAEETASAMPRQ